MTTDNPCPMTDSAFSGKSDVCPECGSSQQYSGVLNFPCRYEWHYREWHDEPAPSEQKLPFANCKYQICDLPGQCVSEGACHHPKEPAPSEQQARREAWEAATDKPTLAPPILPDSLLHIIGEYGMARTDGLNQLQIQHKWGELIRGIKDYASDFAKTCKEPPPATPVSATPSRLRTESAGEIAHEYGRNTAVVLKDDVDQLERELAEARRDADENLQMAEKAWIDTAIAELRKRLNDERTIHEARAAELQTKLDAETKRADGAHNTAIALVCGNANLFLSERQKQCVLEMKVPQ